MCFKTSYPFFPPSLLILICLAIQIFEADWTESQWNYPPTPGQNGYVGSVAYYADSGGNQGAHYRFDPATDDENDVIPFPERLLYRSAPSQVFVSQFWWLGKMADGTKIPVGNYT